ncbi:MAG: hypothetical protein LBR11_13315, partial [Deltaproteobacteria bacterium]|nr:hypothetical protein [Deltaproteobacteria bacterium]
MSQPPIRGLGPEDSTDRRKLRRDIRSPIIRRLAKIGQGVPVACGLVVLMILELVWPQSLLFWLWAMVVLLIAHHLEILKALPLKLPQSAQRVDPHDPGPGRQSWKKAEGKIFLGHDVDSGQEMWISERDLLTHMLLLGTTGSGKTEALISLSLNALITGSGLFYIDPKAAPSLAVQIWQMARLLGRDDDFRVLNFGTPRPDLNLHNRLSNTNNPFSCGTADSLTQILASLMPPTKNGPNSVFAEKAMNLIAGLLQALVDLRDQGRLILSVAKIRQYLSVEFCLSLLDDPYISNSSRSALRSALQTCNWSESRPLALQSAFFEQFGYAQSYFGRALSSLTDTYGHIYGVETGEVDFQDVVLNRRILVVLLPSLEKSPLELASLGKISLSSLKAACAVGLGVEIEGPENETLAALPLNFTGSGPFLAIVDEYAAIVTPGFEMVLTQGRGLGIAAIIASQDYA